MNRREFITICGASYALCGTDFLLADTTTTIKNRTFSLSFDFDLSHIKHTGVSLWVPMPMSNDFQNISDFDITSKTAKPLQTYDNDYYSKALFVKWNKDDEKKLSVNFKATTLPFVQDFTPRRVTKFETVAAKRFVEASKHVQTDGLVKEISDRVASPHKTQLAKARAIYDWVVENMYRDPDVKGCGVGNAKEALEQKRFGGKCLDISAVFVALLRVQNIPARELMGIRIGKSEISSAFGVGENINGGHHCRAEFFIAELGWVRADPADITKLRLQEKLPKNSEREKKIAENYFGNFEMNWMKLNNARDFVLNPKPVQFPLDQFNYPYAEADDEVLDFYDAKSFKYNLTSTETV